MESEEAESKSSSRKDRGVIAAQACESCRAKKQKCDEQRPKCQSCQKHGWECIYREPLPTKKDKTLLEMLTLQKGIGAKVDLIYDMMVNKPPLSSSSRSGYLQPSPLSQISSTIKDEERSSIGTSTRRTSIQSSPFIAGKPPPYQHETAAHKILTWDMMQRLLLQAAPSNLSGLKRLEQEGPAFLLWMYKNVPDLPLVPMAESMQETPFLGMQSQASRMTEGGRSSFRDLTPNAMHHAATEYFNTYNLFYPFMDRSTFMSETLERVKTEGFNGDTDSVIALLVLALGQVAIEGSSGSPIEHHKGRPSGVKGGTISKPPGLALFNEARKRIGFILADCDLENVQIFSLAALYFQSCSRYMDFWRLTELASSACHILVTCNTIDYHTNRGGLIQRAYWHCAIMETALYLELDLPLGPIVSLEEKIGMPGFESPVSEADDRGNQYSHYRNFYASQIALRRLCLSLNNSIHELYNFTMSTPASSTTNLGNPVASLLNQLANQLSEWRSIIPQELQWNEDEPAGNPPQLPRARSQPLEPNVIDSSGFGSGRFFSDDLDSPPVTYPFAYDIQVALLRTRYYYAKYVSHRPFVYKALHFPNQMSREDAEGAAVCLRSCTSWPLLLSPPSRRKRLIPYLFCWSQNFLGILLIIHLSQHNTMLKSIRTEFCGAQFEAEIGRTVELMLDWISDLRSSDPIALWCYEILQGIYQMEL